jgi:hypothetical protein
MAKKSRRARAKFKANQQTVSRGEIRPSEPVKVSSSAKVLKSVSEPPSASAQTIRYQYLLPELRRIGIIAGALSLLY